MIEAPKEIGSVTGKEIHMPLICIVWFSTNIAGRSTTS